MAGLIPNDFIEQLLDRTDILEVIGNRIELKKKGKDHWACCPFHGEKSPSFSVNPSKQFYYCFGCGESGTALKFLQEYDKMNFVEAIEELARGAGVEVPREEVSAKAKQKQQQRRSLHDLLGSCSEYFAHQLYQHADSKPVQRYVLDRGLTEEVVRTFQIGFAPEGWNNLSQHFRNEQTDRELLTTGMLTQNDKGRVYDRFRNRLMFPIRDIRGRVIAFGGRVMSADEQPKYLNSPETPVFHKGQELYGLYEARKAVKNFDNIIIVEGYMDVVALAQHGVKNAVATLGTATSPTHIQRLFKLTTEIIFCFDGDAAGKRAAIRALTNTLPELKDGLQARFLFLPDGEDPDSLVRKEGFEGFMFRAKQAQSLPDFLFQHLQTQADISRLDGKARLVSIARGWIEKVPEGIFRQLLLGELSSLVGLPTEQIIANFEPVAPKIEPASESQESSNPDHWPIPVDAAYDMGSAPAPRSGGRTGALVVKIGYIHRALAWLIRFPQLALDIDIERIRRLPPQNDRLLLISVIELLQKAPKDNLYYAFDYLCQHGLRETLSPIATSDYLWLEAANEDHKDEQAFGRQELEKIINGLTQRAPDDEYETLKKRALALDPSLTDAEKQRYRELLKQRKQ
ncbi:MULTISPECIES: DNA primase [Reinekea]|jgi:DNA primase|uniref:DNA primase n=1 Tax=Reinekea forsetii TaxID=1336806 RepID=A0A2K8KMG7_9GAMM|nr:MULTISPECIES: DNA primase [Reinekea]ATX76025.1 DNA primase [Reinekea forsetii]MDO7643511.1 DNA primase [Reinekea forsetii]